MQDAEAYYKQEQNIKYVSDSYGKESWVRVSGKDILNRAEAHFWCALIKKTKVKNPAQNNILNFVLPAKMIAAVINK